MEKELVSDLGNKVNVDLPDDAKNFTVIEYPNHFKIYFETKTDKNKYPNLISNNLSYIEIFKPAEERLNELTDDDGFFKSRYPGNKDDFSIGFLEELCEWIYLNPDNTYEYKLKTILDLEEMIQYALNGGEDERPMVRGGINYIPTWSTKLINEKNV